MARVDEQTSGERCRLEARSRNFSFVERQTVMQEEQSLGREFAAEVVGTFFLVFFGTGSVFVGAITGALQGLLQVAVVWGLAIAWQFMPSAQSAGRI